LADITNVQWKQKINYLDFTENKNKETVRARWLTRYTGTTKKATWSTMIVALRPDPVIMDRT